MIPSGYISIDGPVSRQHTGVEFEILDFTEVARVIADHCRRYGVPELSAELADELIARYRRGATPKVVHRDVAGGGRIVAAIVGYD